MNLFVSPTITGEQVQSKQNMNYNEVINIQYNTCWGMYHQLVWTTGVSVYG